VPTPTATSPPNTCSTPPSPRPGCAPSPAPGSGTPTSALTFAGAVFLLGELLSFTGFGIGQAILGPKHLGASLRDTDVLRAVIGGGVYLTLVGLQGMALGALIRRTAGGLATLFGLLFLAMLIASTLPASWYDRMGQYLPASAGSQIMFVVPLDQHVLGPWSGVGVLALYVTAVFGPAAYMVGRRDA
jgi:ABC-2 type transport system permease protein